ncbi:peptide-methionine (S)-S-oxide reductase MsrA [Kangiella sp. TOML190]|uniref:peptide-methionine (S)-S-oxide reductase MsrA n=1 Tax=Kangiella sp. TOML190 TaxID=2931351 RepID=UPI00203B3625|nr:peptide-methionine (S)-S-oxide reductase MsrA [Kangiella sp. TOML190]
MTTDKEFELATFGGGCFWCVEAVIQKLNGVAKVVSGYAGGHDPEPNYTSVCSGSTGHAEVIQVSFDASVISYKDLLEVFMTSHNPTQRDGQGADIGTQYRSIILYHSDKQKQVANTVLEEMASLFEQPIVTELVPLEIFYPAESYHQDYYNRNPENRYCSIVIEPKLAKLKQKHADKLMPNQAAELPKVIHQADKEQFLVELEPNQFALLRYTNHGGYLSLDYTEVPMELRGKGYGSVLMKMTLTEIEKLGFKVEPICSYTKIYLQRHQEWQHLRV